MRTPRIQHEPARRRLDSTAGAWEFLGASEIKMYAIDKGDIVHGSAVLAASAFQVIPVNLNKISHFCSNSVSGASFLPHSEPL